jgi:hypothetical protein
MAKAQIAASSKSNAAAAKKATAKKAFAAKKVAPKAKVGASARSGNAKRGAEQRVKVSQDAVKAFAFPTRKSMKALAKTLTVGTVVGEKGGQERVGMVHAVPGSGSTIPSGTVGVIWDEGKGVEVYAGGMLEVVKNPSKRLKADIGTAIEQNREYAKLAKKYTLGAEVQELQEPKRHGIVQAVAAKGSGYVTVQFGIAVEAKHVGDLKLLGQHQALLAPTTSAPVVHTAWEVGTRVEHPTHGLGVVAISAEGMPDDVATVHFDDGDQVAKEIAASELKVINDTFAVGEIVEHAEHGMGRIETLHPNATTAAVRFLDADVVVTRKLSELHSLKDAEITIERAADAAVTPVSKVKRVRFDELGLFEAFVHEDRTHVKVGNTSALRVVVAGITSEPFAMLATQESKLVKDAKVRFRLKDKVARYAVHAAQ